MSTGDAVHDFEQRVGRRSERVIAGDGRLPDPPARLRAEEGAGQITLRWAPVPDAMGYLVHRASGPRGPFEPLDHSGGDVLAVPRGPYADTTGTPGTPAWYAVASVADVEHGPGPLSEPIQATPQRASEAAVTLTASLDKRAGQLRRLWQMIGSERLSQLLVDTTTGGRPVAAEVDAALKLARDELGVRWIRAHAILHDDLGVYRGGDGRAHHDFSAVDRVYDRLVALGLRPVVELSFMPRDLARDADATVFAYDAVISPPRDWDRWTQLISRLAAHLVQRYGIDEVSQWGFEVWNEANLEVFWTGTFAEYLRLYETAAQAIKAVDVRLRVGGPATAAAGWVGAFLDGVIERDLPLDFVSTHTYGNVPLDVRTALELRGISGVEVWWTEWGVTPTHFFEVTDGAFGAPFVLHGMKGAQDGADAVAYWVVSDHFEELGRPERLLHGGFGLLTVGNLRKPRWWALALAQQLGDDLARVELSGDGAGSLVDAWVTAHPDGTVDVLAWNGTLDQTKRAGAAILDRRLEIVLSGLVHERYAVTLVRVDNHHGNIAERWDADRGWPDGPGWEALAAADHLDEEPAADLTPVDGTAHLQTHLPMPGVVRVRLRPVS